MTHFNIALTIYAGGLLGMASMAILCFKIAEEGFKEEKERQNKERIPKRLLDRK